MNYKEAMEYVEQVSKQGSVLGLDNIKELLNRLDNPQNCLKFVHIAGTNGKGSTLAFISTVLACAGYKVGRYVSPTVFEYRERIQINGKYISKADLGKFMGRIKEASDSMEREGMTPPTQFEVETALSFLYYKEKKCDMVVLETGLGGRLDATNVITTTLVAVIASISMDHMNFLGDTLEEIAQNKAGIIKNNCYVIAMKQDERVLKVIQQTCKEKDASYQVADGSLATSVKSSLTKQSFHYKEYKGIEIGLLGEVQIANCVLAIECLKILEQLGYHIPEKSLREGLAKTLWAGRFSIIAKKPYFIIDGAHNEDAAKKLAQSITSYFPNKEIIYIMGVLRDKEHDKIIKETYQYATHIITVTTPNSERTMHAYDLAQEVKQYHPSVTVADSLEEAVEISYLLANKDSVIIAFGSLSYLGALTQIVNHRANLKLRL